MDLYMYVCMFVCIADSGGRSPRVAQIAEIQRGETPAGVYG
jgi:hypothetical protein